MTDTLGDLARRGYSLDLYCHRCRRIDERPAAALAQHLGPQLELAEAGRGLECRHCSGTWITVMRGPPPLPELLPII
jgi:primosomal protein N'